MKGFWVFIGCAAWVFIWSTSDGINVSTVVASLAGNSNSTDVRVADKRALVIIAKEIQLTAENKKHINLT